MFFCPGISSSQHCLQKNDEGIVALTEDVAIWKVLNTSCFPNIEERDIFDFDKTASLFRMMLNETLGIKNGKFIQIMEKKRLKKE